MPSNANKAQPPSLIAVARTSVSILAISSALAMTAVGKALAQEAPHPQQAQVAGTATFDIPAQPLASALTSFGRQAGLQVIFDSGSVSGKSSSAVVGRMSSEQALQQLLAGTGTTYRVSSPTSITVTSVNASGALQLDPVQVQGFPVPQQAMIDNAPPPYAGGQVATGGQLGLLGNRGVMDTPFNQTNYTAQKAQDQQAQTVKDVLIDDPSVRTLFPNGAAGIDNIRIRGFPVVVEDYTYGGIYGVLPARSIMAELAERVEVLKGPSAMLNGMPTGSSIGGAINIVPKRAPNEDLTQVTANYVSAGQVGGHADLARRFGSDKQFGVRFNGVYRAGQTAVENNTDQVGLAVLGLDFRGERVRLAADLGYQYQYIGGVMAYLGVNNGVPLPWAPNARMNQGQPWAYVERKDLFGVVRAEVDLTERITAYAAVGAHDSRGENYQVLDVAANDFNGAATASGPNRLSQYRTFLAVNAGVRGLFDTGPLGHEFALTATTLQNQNGSAFLRVAGSAFATNIYNPTIIAPPAIAMPAANKTSTTSLSSWALADTLSTADKRVQLTVGARLQQVQSANFDPTSGAQTANYDQSAVSPSVALVFKPWQNVSVYGNWIQGLQPGEIVGPAFTNAGEIFPPFKSTQYEAGVKVDWGRFTTTASAFQISQPSLLTNVATNTQYLGGEQVNQGLELNVFGEPIEGVRLLGGVMLLNAMLSKTQGGLTDGWIAPFAPGFNLNLAGEWDLPFVRGMTLNGRVVYTGSQYIDTTWPRRSLPDWTRFDLGARYAFENPGAKGKLLVARFNVDNVLDANYWAGGIGAGTLMLGAPRTFRLSLTADF